ncbi:tail completion protein gp17 [Martelella alba]|uniref:DUF3168 domain-containing protein n=1 Tax=Martelella alba TaxID=2590451 RepID=A0ABY2SEB1_9HYPH|nr:DUF3168 domain-containing protein [Martelella alba]TKI02764.1 DUF3168 domain-containing protein [Martelella alba]
MTEADIYSVLGGLAGGQVYPYVAPLNPQGDAAISPPWVVFSLISEVDSDVMCGQAEGFITLQVDVYAQSIDDASAIRSQALLALTPLKPTNINRTGGYEPDTGLYRATLEAQIWQ